MLIEIRDQYDDGQPEEAVETGDGLHAAALIASAVRNCGIVTDVAQNAAGDGLSAAIRFRDGTRTLICNGAREEIRLVHLYAESLKAKIGDMDATELLLGLVPEPGRPRFRDREDLLDD